jgi:hypothetical protein
MSALQDVRVSTLHHALAVLAKEGLVVLRQGRIAAVAGDVMVIVGRSGLRATGTMTASVPVASRTCAGRWRQRRSGTSIASCPAPLPHPNAGSGSLGTEQIVEAA